MISLPSSFLHHGRSKRKRLTEDDISKLLDEFDAEDGDISSSESPSSDTEMADDESSDDDIALPRDWTTIGKEKFPLHFVQMLVSNSP